MNLGEIDTREVSQAAKASELVHDDLTLSWRADGNGPAATPRCVLLRHRVRVTKRHLQVAMMICYLIRADDGIRGEVLEDKKGACIS